MRYAYDMLGNRIHQLSMEAGARWMLNDVAGKPIRAWDSRGHNFTTAYDALRRPVEQYRARHDQRDSDPRTLNRDTPGRQDRVRRTRRLNATAAQERGAALNLRTRIYRHFDSAGVATNARLDANGNPLEAYDFKGNLLRSTRRLASDYTAIPDWPLNPQPQLDAEPFEGSTRYDALNRPIQSIAPHSSLRAGRQAQRHPAGVQRGQPAGAGGRVAGTRRPNPPACSTRADRAAVAGRRRQHRLRRQGPATAHRLQERRQVIRTTYAYDPRDLPADAPLHATRRGPSTAQGMRSPTTASPAARRRIAAPATPPQGKACGLQNLHYTYDPAGNITHIHDDAQQTIYFRNQRVEPSNDYTYDALYRLIQATGREHLGQAGAPIPHSHNDAGRGASSAPIHTRHDSRRTTAAPWARTSSATCTTPSATSCRCSTAAATRRMRAGRARYAYAEASLIEPGKQSNRLSSHHAVGNAPQPKPTSTTPTATWCACRTCGGMHWDFERPAGTTRDQLRQRRRR